MAARCDRPAARTRRSDASVHRLARTVHGTWRIGLRSANLTGLNVEVPLATGGLCDDTTLAMDGGCACWSDGRPSPDRPGRGGPVGVRQPQQQHHRQAARVRARWRGPRAPGRRSRQIADANGGNRFSGFRATTRRSTTWSTGSRPPATTPRSSRSTTSRSRSSARRRSSRPRRARVTYVEGVDFGVITQSDPGDVTAAVTAVDLQLGLGNTSTSGCEAADFAGFPAGNIALLQRGTCTFELKAENAAAAGAVGHRDLQPGQHRRRRPPGHPGGHARRPTTPAASR